MQIKQIVCLIYAVNCRCPQIRRSHRCSPSIAGVRCPLRFQRSRPDVSHKLSDDARNRIVTQTWGDASCRWQPRIVHRIPVFNFSSGRSFRPARFQRCIDAIVEPCRQTSPSGSPSIDQLARRQFSSSSVSESIFFLVFQYTHIAPRRQRDHGRRPGDDFAGASLTVTA